MIIGELLKRQHVNETKWNEFIDESPQHSIYCQSWYLDSLCSNWEAIIIKENGDWLAIMPLNLDSKFRLRYSVQPIFTQYLGLLFAPLELKQHKELELKRKIIKTVIGLIPKNIRIIDYNFSPKFKYFLPFVWEGYSVIPRISYQLTLKKNIEEVICNYSSRIKDDIKKSIKNNLICFTSNDINDLIHMCYTNSIINKKSCIRFKMLWDQIIIRKNGYCIYAKDENNNIHCGGAFIIYKEKIIFILLSTKNEYKKFGSTSFLINEAIKQAIDNPKIKSFDFEGSMIESIEKYFIGFNPSPITYFKIQKNKLHTLMNILQKSKLLISKYKR